MLILRDILIYCHYITGLKAIEIARLVSEHWHGARV